MPKHFVEGLSDLLFSAFPLPGSLDLTEKVVETVVCNSLEVSLQGVEIIVLGLKWCNGAQITQAENGK